MNRTVWPTVFLGLLLIACGDPADEPDSGSDVGSDPEPDNIFADTSPADTGAPDTVLPDVPVVEGLPIPFSENLGPCTRQVRVGQEGFLLYSFVYNYEEAPAVVTAIRSTGGELDVAIDYFNVDTRRFCAKPPEERHGAFVDIIGCPTRIIIDTDDNGLISPLDLAVNYTFDEFGNISASDRFDWRNNFTGSAWFFDYNADGALLSGRRRDAGAVAETMVATYPADLQMVLTYDDEGDGTIDSRVTYQFDAAGDLVETSVEESDPGTGELGVRSVSTYSYACWDE